MDSNCRKLGETPYRECRKQAAIYNDALGSMERAAEMLGVSRPTLYKMIKEGKIPALRLRRRIVIPIDEFNEWVRIESWGAVKATI